MKQLIVSDKVQKEMLTDDMIMGETRGLIGGYCENEFPVYYANEEMARMLGYDAVEEMVEAIDGKVIHTIHPDDREQVIKDIGDEYYEGLTYETTYRMPRKDGSWFWTVDKGKVIRTEDGKLAIISVCQDMTSFVERHKKLEDSNKILNERNRILSALSRDYTTILLCDLKQDTFEVVKGDTFTHHDHEEKQKLVRESNCYSERVRYFFENVLIKESVPEYLERLLPEYLMNELQETDSIEIYYKTIPNGSGFRPVMLSNTRREAEM